MSEFSADHHTPNTYQDHKSESSTHHHHLASIAAGFFIQVTRVGSSHLALVIACDFSWHKMSCYIFEVALSQNTRIHRFLLPFVATVSGDFIHMRIRMRS